MSIRTAKQELVTEGIVDYWFDLALREADSESNKNADVRVSALNLLVDLWVAFPSKVEEKDEVATAILTALKRGCREKNRLLQHFSLSKLFHMLEVFTLDRNAYAPILYKTLTFSLVENYHDPTIRELLMQNFAVTFERNQSMPVGIVVEPLVRQLQVSQDAAYNIFDVDFFVTVAKHPRLTVKHAVQILDVLGKTYINDLLFNRATRVPFMLVTSRFVDSAILHELMQRLLTYLLKIVVSAEVAKERPDRQLVIRHDVILALVVSIVELKHGELNEKIKQLLLTANAEVRRNSKHDSGPICKILGLLGNAEEMVKEYADLHPVPVPLEPDPVYEPIVNQEPSESGQSKGDGKKKYRPPRTPVGRATIDIDRARRKRLEKDLKEQILAELKEAEEKRIRNRTKKVATKRKIIIAVDKNTDEGEAVEVSRVKVVSLTELALDEHDAINNVLRRYGRVLRLLFKKYSSSGYVRNMKSGTFDALAERKTSLAPAEYFKLLKEQGVGPNLMTLEEFDQLLKAYVKETHRSSGILEFEAYLQFFVQIAIYVFSKPPKDLSYLHPVLSVKSLIDLFRQTTEARRLPTLMYDEPDPGSGDRDIIQKLNALLIVDPEAPLPEGYRRVVEKELYVEHVVPAVLNLKESQTIAASLMDELIHKLFGVHFLEPTIGFSSYTRVKGTLVRKGMNLVTRKTFENVGQVPGFMQLSPGIKYEAVKLQGSQPPELLFEVAKTLDDLASSLEQGNTAVFINRQYNQPRNKLLIQKTIEEQKAKVDQVQKDRKRKLRKQLVEQRLKSEKQTKDQKAQAEEEEKQRLKQQDKILKQKLEAKRRKQQAERDKVLQEWRLKKEADEKQKSEAEQKKLAEDFSKKQLLRESYRKKEAKKIKRLLNERQQKHAEEMKAEQDKAKELADRKLKDRKVFKAKLIEARKQREQERKSKADLAKQMSEGPVVEIMKEYGGSVDVVFKHFCRVSAASNAEVLNSSVLPFPGFNRFAIMFKIWPALVSADDSMQVFRSLTKEKLPDSKVPISLTRGDFNDALLRIALKGRRALGLQLDAPPDLAIRSMFDWLNLTPDPKKTVDMLRLMTAQQPLDSLLANKKPKRSASQASAKQ